MKPSVKICLFTILVLGSVISAFSFSDSQGVGTVSITQAPVYVIRNGIQKSIGSFGLSLKLNDEVVTGDTGKAYIMLSDESQIVVGAKTRLKITKGAIEKKGSGIKRFILGLIGKIRARVKKSQGTFQVKTSTATIGVKGTDFIVDFSGTETTVGTLEGLVNMKSNASGQDLDIPPGKMSSVSSGGEVMKLTDISGTLLTGVEIAGEKMPEKDISGEKIR